MKFVPIILLISALLNISGCAKIFQSEEIVQKREVQIEAYPVYFDSTINFEYNSPLRGSPKLIFKARKKEGKVNLHYEFISNLKVLYEKDTIAGDPTEFDSLLRVLMDYKGDYCRSALYFDYDIKVISYSDGNTTKLFGIVPCKEYGKTQAYVLYPKIVDIFRTVEVPLTKDDIVNKKLKEIFGN